MMEGIEKIIDRIHADSQLEIDAILADANVQAAQIATDCQAQATQQAADIVARGAQEAVQHEARLVGVAQLDCRKQLLATKQEMMQQAFDQALAHLCSLPEGECLALLTDLLLQATRTGNEQVILSPADRETYGQALVAQANAQLGEKGNLTLADHTRPLQGGLIVSDGAVDINCSFETLVRLQQGVIDRSVAQILFDSPQ